MWNKFSQAAGLSAPEGEAETAEEKNVEGEEQEQLQQQQLMIKQLKDLLRENEKRFQDKEKELQDISNKFQKFKLQSKAKISHLSNQLKEHEKSTKKEDCDFDDTSSSDSSEQSHRGKLLFLKKQLGQVKQQLEKKDEEFKKVSKTFESKVFDLEAQLNEKNLLISSFADKKIADKEQETADRSPKKESSIQEMYAQIVYKDSKILELNHQILEHEKQIMDLQEHIKEKDEVLQQRNRAVQLMAEDLSRKGQTVVSELDETRDQMKIMQENFASTELEWKSELEKQKTHIVELENEISEQNKKLKTVELSAKNLESARYELSLKNAELQKKMVIVQESAAKQCETYNKEIGGEVENLKKSLEAEKKHSSELQASLDEFNSQSENKVLKARVKERTKYKALERELNALKKSNEEKPKEVLELQQHIAELEEDKGSLQLKIMDYEEQIILLDKLKEENEKLSSDLKESQNTTEQYQKQITELEADNDTWKKKFQSLDENIDLLQQNLNSISEEKYALERKLSEKKQLERDYALLKSSHSEFENMYNETVMTLNELRDIKVSFELKNIELEEMRESDEKVRKELELQINQLQDTLNNESKPEIQMQKEYLELKDLLQSVTQSLKFSEDKMKELLEENEVLKSDLCKKDLEITNYVKESQEKNDLVLFNEEKVRNLMTEVEKLTNTFKEQVILKDDSISNLNSDLQNKISSEFHLKEQIKSFQEKIHQLESSKSEIEMTCQDFNTQINVLHQYISEKDFCVSELESKIENKTVIIEALNKQIEILQKTALDFHNLKMEQENIINQVNHQEKYAKELKDAILEKDSYISKLEFEMEDKITSTSSLTQTIHEQSEKLEQSLKHQEHLNEELKILKSKFSEQSGLISKKDEFILQLQSELKDKITSETSLTQTVQEQLENLTQSLKHQDSLSNELMLLKKDQTAECEKVQSKMASLLEQIDDLENELSHIQEKLDSKAKDLETAESKITDLEKQNSYQSKTLEEQAGVLRMKSDLADKWELEHKNTKDELEKYAKENMQLKSALSVQMSEVTSLNENLFKVKNHLERSNDEVVKLTVELENLKTDVLHKAKIIKEFEEQNFILKEEVTHSSLSLTEKEEIYQKNMEEKLKFEADYLKLKEESKLKESALKSKSEECEILNLKINELSNAIEISTNSAQNLTVELEHSQKELQKLKTLFEEQQLTIEKKNRDVIELQKCIHELEEEILVQKEKVNNYVISNEEQISYSNGLSSKLSLIENELEECKSMKAKLEQEYFDIKNKFDDAINARNEFEKQMLEYQTDVKKLSEEKNCLEKKNIMYSDQVSFCTNEIEKYRQSETDTKNSIQNLNKLNIELTEKCKSIELAANEYENQSKELVEQIKTLDQKCQQYEKLLSEANEKVLNNEKQIKTLESEVEISKNISLKEKSEIEILYQNLFLEKNVLSATIQELEKDLNNYRKENEKLKHHTLQLQEDINEKNKSIEERENKLCGLKNELENSVMNCTHIQNVFDEECKNMQNFKENYYSFLKHLSSSLQLQETIPSLDDIISCEDFFIKSKSVSDAISLQVVPLYEKFQETHREMSNYQSLEQDYECIQAEKSMLQAQHKSLYSDLQYFIDNLDSSSQFVQKTLRNILSDLELKSNALDKVNVQFEALSNVTCMQANKIEALEIEKNSLEQKLLETKELLSACEQKVNDLSESQEKANVELLSDNHKFKQQISELEVALNEATANSEQLSANLEHKSSVVENYEEQLQKFSSMIETNQETIVKLQQEQQNKDNSLTSLQSKFNEAQSVILSLQNEISEMKRLQNETVELHVLESSHNVSNDLQVEIENLHKELQLIEEQKSSLLQHLENCNSQLQLSASEKVALETTVEQMNKKIDDLIETNKNLSNSFEESQHLLKVKQENIDHLENKLQESVKTSDELCEEIKKLKSIQADAQSGEFEKVVALDRRFSSLKCILTDLWSAFSQIDSIDNFDFKLVNLPSEFDPESLKIVANVCDEIMRLKSFHEEEKKKFQTYVDESDIKNNELSEEIQLLQNKLQKYETLAYSDEKSDEVQTKDIVLPVGLSQKLDKELLLQLDPTSMPVLSDYQNENESLKQEIHSLKLKSAKMLTKLKLFRDKTAKLSGDLKMVKDSNAEVTDLNNKLIKNEKDLETLISSLKGENQTLSSKLQCMETEQLHMVDKSNDIISQLKERNLLLDQECSKLRKELQDYRYTWEQSSISYELQKEDNERFRAKLAESTEQVANLKSKTSDLNLQLVQLEKENNHLKQETQNLQEHVKMLLSDNDTYQNLTEKLTSAKNGLEQKIMEMKEKFQVEKAEWEKKVDLKKRETSETSVELRSIDELENETISLKKLCAELKSDKQIIQRERDTYLKNKNLLEKEKLYLQQQLLEKVDEIDRINCQLQEAMSLQSQSSFQSVVDPLGPGAALTEQYEKKVNELKEENRGLKSKLNALTQELNLTNKKFEFLQNDIQNKESMYKEQISYAEQQLREAQPNVSTFHSKIEAPTSNTNLENELQQAMNSLHRQGLRCEELSLEVSRLLEERNNLQWRLQQCQQNVLQKSSEKNLQLPECVSIQVETSSENNFEVDQLSHSNVKLLQERLQQSEKTCQELRRANEALDQALIHERDQKRQIEEELGYAQEHLNVEAKASDEYQILLGDIEAPEMFAETNFSISRNVKTHAYKFRRWLNGRKNYLYRTVKGRKYSQLIYLFYIFFIHVWLLMCIF